MSVIPSIAELISINEGEAIFLPLFDSKLHDISQWEFDCDNQPQSEWTQAGDCCVAKATARRFRLHWRGEAILTDKTSIRLFTSFMKEAQLRGYATINDCRVLLFERIAGDAVPIEPTSRPIGEGVLSDLELELEFPEVTHFSWNVYWIGVVDSKKEERLQAPLNHPLHWNGLLYPEARASLCNPWIASPQELQDWKARLRQKNWSPVRLRIEEEASRWENYRPELDLREFLPVEPHLYRYARVRDRNRPLWDHPMMILALAGYLCERPVWTQLAARFLLSMAWTPNWFEGPQGCFPGSDWHHVCFVESHNLLAAIFALQFVGDALTEHGRKIVWKRVHEAWLLVDEKCREPGYRWHMNQGVVFNSIRLAGAVALWNARREPHYEQKIEIAYRDHCQVIDNYLAADGHCCEGPHYFAYSMSASISAWMAYAAYRQLSVESVLPDKFIRASTYVEFTSSMLHPAGFHLPICAAECEAWPVGILTLLAAKKGGAAAVFLAQRWKSRFEDSRLTAWDIAALLSQPVSRKMLPAVTHATQTLSMVSGLGCVRWGQPNPGQLLLTAERASTGHHHYDRGSLILESANQPLLIDPGMTNYAYPRCAEMREPDWHNTAHPVGIRMKCHNRPEELRQDYPRADLRLQQESEQLYRFRIDLTDIYDLPVLKAIRAGTLWLDAAHKKGRLSICDEWEFSEKTVLEITWQSLKAWELHPGSAFTGSLQCQCHSRDERDIEWDTLSDRVDWKLTPVHTLRIRTGRQLSSCLHTEITFPL